MADTNCVTYVDPEDETNIAVSNVTFKMCYSPVPRPLKRPNNNGNSAPLKKRRENPLNEITSTPPEDRQTVGSWKRMFCCF